MGKPRTRRRYSRVTKHEIRRAVIFRVGRIKAAFNKVRRVLNGKGTARDVLTMHNDVARAHKYLAWIVSNA